MFFRFYSLDVIPGRDFRCYSLDVVPVRPRSHCGTWYEILFITDVSVVVEISLAPRLHLGRLLCEVST